MIVTLTESTDGQRRVYLGGKASLECYLAPRDDGVGWTFHLEEAVTGNKISANEKRNWALHTLQQLAFALGVGLDRLNLVPFAEITALHAADPYLARRVVSPKARVIENGFTAVSFATRTPTRDAGATGARALRTRT